MVAPSEAVIIDTYGHADVKFGDVVMPLIAAEQFQRLAGCAGSDPNRVNDPTLRAERLVKALHDAGSLEPRHQHWLLKD